MKNSKVAFGVVLVVLLAGAFVFFRRSSVPTTGSENGEGSQPDALADTASCVKAWSDSWRRDLTDAALFQEAFYPGLLSVGFNGTMSDEEITDYVDAQGLSLDPDYPDILDFTVGSGVKAVRLIVPEEEEIEWICRLTDNRSPLIVQDQDATIVFADPVPLPAVLPAM